MEKVTKQTKLAARESFDEYADQQIAGLLEKLGTDKELDAVKEICGLMRQSAEQAGKADAAA